MVDETGGDVLVNLFAVYGEVDFSEFEADFSKLVEAVELCKFDVDFSKLVEAVELAKLGEPSEIIGLSKIFDFPKIFDFSNPPFSTFSGSQLPTAVSTDDWNHPRCWSEPSR